MERPMVRRILLTVTTTLVFGLAVYFSKTTYTAQLVIVESVNANNIVVLDYSGIKTTVSIPKGISELIHEGEEYFIRYTTRMWQTPHMEKISPIQ